MQMCSISFSMLKRSKVIIYLSVAFCFSYFFSKYMSLFIDDTSTRGQNENVEDER